MGAGGHHVYQCVVVVQGVQIPDTGLNFPFVHSEAGIELEQTRIADQVGAFQLLGDIVNVVGGGDGDGHLVILPAEGQHVRRADPDHPAQRNADGQNNGDPDQCHKDVGNAQQALALPPLGAALGGGVIPDRNLILCFRFGAEKLLKVGVLFREGHVFHGHIVGNFAVVVNSLREYLLRFFRKVFGNICGVVRIRRLV